ncbi:MAG TPA: guanylate kinase [Bacteroidota bacterium]|nr:guanylate kinase [Bacteroidota bacterium]
MPKLIVLSAPSGSGKTTIAREILKRHPGMLFSVSATTRPKREFEVDGKDYFFLTLEQFEKRIEEDLLIEWEEIYGHYYGTLKSEVDRARGNRKPMLFDVDVKGALSIKRQYPHDSILVFIKPPNLEALTERLKKRKTESAQTIRRRMERVPMEVERAGEFDFCVVNDDLDKAVIAVDDVITNAIAAVA